MANEVFKGLFGFSPEELTQQRQAENDARAFQMAQLNPLQQTSYQGFKAAQGVGDSIRGIGQKLFNIEDPQMKESALLDSSAKELFSQGIDPMSSKGLSILAERVSAAGGRSETMSRLLQAKQQAAMQEAKIASEQALTSQRNRESNPKEVQLLNLYNSLPDDDPRKEMIKEMLVKEKSQTDPELVKLQDARDALPKGSARYKELDDFIKAKITGEATRGSTTIQMPGMDKPKDIPNLRRDIQQTIQPQLIAYEAAEKALININEAQKNDNPVALNTAIRGLAKAVDGGQISNKDVQDAGGDPSLLGRIGDWGSILATGLPTDKTVINIKRTIAAMQKVAKRNLEREIDSQRDLYNRAGYVPADVDLILGGFIKNKPTVKKQQLTTKSGVTYTVEE